MKKEALLIRQLLNLNKERKEKIIKEISPSINWAYFLETAKKERVAALLHKLSSKAIKLNDLLPKDILEHLKNIYFWIQRENMLCLKHIKQILSVFENNCVNVLTFKGPVLAELIYNDLGLRPMRDWDILIKPQDFQTVNRILEREFSYFKRFKLNSSSEIKVNRYRNSILYSNIKAYPKHIHLYWHLINLLPYNNTILSKMNMGRVWQDSIIADLGDIKLRTLSSEHHLIYLCQHALNHGYKPLLLICDINEVARKSGINWQILVEEAINFGLSTPVYYGLYLASKILGADIPSGALMSLKPKKQSSFEFKFFSSLTKGERVLNDQNTAFLLNLFFNKSLKDRLKFIYAALFPPRKNLSLIRQAELNKFSLIEYLKRAKAGLTSFIRATYPFVNDQVTQ